MRENYYEVARRATFAHEKHKMILWQPIPQARRQQQILLGQVRAIGSWPSPAVKYITGRSDLEWS
jgi:hypothetical protein